MDSSHLLLEEEVKTKENDTYWAKLFFLIEGRVFVRRFLVLSGKLNDCAERGLINEG